MPPSKKTLLNKQLKGAERKFFDSGDYALSKAGKQAPSDVGSQHPSPERIPHSVPANMRKPDITNAPAKESSLVHEAELPK